MTKPQLIAELKAKGIKGYSKLNKADLILLLKEGTKSAEPVVPAKRIIKPFSSSKLTNFIFAGPYGLDSSGLNRAGPPQGKIGNIPFHPQTSFKLYPHRQLHVADTLIRRENAFIGKEASRIKDRERRKEEKSRREEDARFTMTWNMRNGRLIGADK